MQDDQTGMPSMVDAGMVDDAVDGGEGGPVAESETTRTGHDPETLAAMEKPQVADLQAAAGAFHAAFNTALYELDNTRRELAERSTRIEELDEAILSVRAKLDAEVEAGRKREEEHLDEAGQLRQRIEAAEAECERLQETAAAQEHTLSERTAEIGDLTARLDELNAALEQRTAAGIQAQEAFDSETGRLNSELAGLQQALEEATGRLQAQQHELEQRNREVADLEDRISGLNTELEAKNGELARLDRQADEMQGELEAQTEALRAQSESHAAARAELDSQVSRLSTELETLRVAQRDLQAHAEKLENLNQALHESSSTEKTVHRQQLEEKNAELESLNARLEAVQATVRDLQDNRPASDALQARVRELETRLQKAESGAAALGERAAEADRMESLNARLRGALRKAREAVSRNAGESDKLQVLNEQIEELQSALEQSRQDEQLPGGKLQDCDTPEGEAAQPGEAAIPARQASPGQEDSELVAQLRADLAAAEERCRQLEAAQAAGISAHVPAVTGQGGQELLREPAVDRAGFITHLDDLLAAGAKAEQGYTLMYILLDNFINIRDEIGVIKSESVLNEVAQIIASVCDAGAVSARFGDCTFSVLCSNTTVEETEQKADRIRAMVESRIFGDGGRSVVATASIGVASVRQSDSSAHDVVSRADLACEAARLSGGNKVTSSSAVDADIGATGKREFHEETISRTLAENRLKIYYQPITNLREESGNHFEVLVRIVDEAGDIILPGEFFSMAETTGQSAEIDRYVIEHIVRTLSESRDPEMRLFIKLTRQSVADPGLPAWIAALILEHGVNTQQLVFEVAEAVMLADLGGLSSLSNALHEAGCKVAIEHFRMSSQPKHLAHVHVDYLKIDASLVEDISHRGEPLARVAAIMELANRNGYLTIAEGVETSASLAILWELGVGLAQGYFIQAPAVSREFHDQDDAAGCNKAVFEIS